MGNIDWDDNVVKRLGKLVPIYTITLFSSVGLLLDQIVLIGSPMQGKIGVGVLMAVGIALTLYVEMRVNSVNNKIQIALAVINGTVWIFLINIGVFEFQQIVLTWVSFVIALYTFGLGFVPAGIWEPIPKTERDNLKLLKALLKEFDRPLKFNDKLNTEPSYSVQDGHVYGLNLSGILFPNTANATDRLFKIVQQFIFLKELYLKNTTIPNFPPEINNMASIEVKEIS